MVGKTNRRLYEFMSFYHFWGLLVRTKVIVVN